MHGHKMHPNDEEWETCTDLQCPCDELAMTRDEIDLLDNVAAAYPIIVEFQTIDGKLGDVDLIWEWDHLDVGWNDYATAAKAAMFYQKGAVRAPRVVMREGPLMAKHRIGS